MSCTQICCFNADSKITILKEFQNAFWGSVRIREGLGFKYIPGFTCMLFFGHEIDRLPRYHHLENYELIALYTTYSNVLVKREHFLEVANAFREIEEQDPTREGSGSNLLEQAAFIEDLYNNHPEIAVIGWNQSTVSDNDWTSRGIVPHPDNQKELSVQEQWENLNHCKTSDYNFLTQDDHWFLFEGLAEDRRRGIIS